MVHELKQFSRRSPTISKQAPSHLSACGRSAERYHPVGAEDDQVVGTREGRAWITPDAGKTRCCAAVGRGRLLTSGVFVVDEIFGIKSHDLSMTEVEVEHLAKIGLEHPGAVQV